MRRSESVAFEWPGDGVEDVVEEYLDRIGPADHGAMRAAAARQLTLTKPAGSLGVLEELSVRVAGMTGSCPPAVPAPAVVTVFAADHGVHAQGVSPWPQEVTAAMLANFAAGGAAVNAFAANNRVDVRVVDVGVATPVDELDIIHAKVRSGTRDLSTTEALTEDETRAAIAGRLRPGRHAGQGRLPLPAHRRHGGSRTPPRAPP
jgi:nicotinate-nucleotide--dimethylbenzimidazole phosphoribosyltransferase